MFGVLIIALGKVNNIHLRIVFVFRKETPRVLEQKSLTHLDVMIPTIMHGALNNVIG